MAARIPLFLCRLAVLAAIVTAGSAPVRAALVATGVAGTNLQGYWQFDESNNASPPLANPTPDQSGHGRNGTYLAGLGRVADATFSPILRASNMVLDVHTVADNRVTVATPSPVSAFGSGSSFSVSMWMNLDLGQSSNDTPSMAAFAFATNQGWRIGYSTNPSYRWLFVGQNNGSGETFIASQMGVATSIAGTWHLLTYTFNSSNGSAKLYLDGTVLSLYPGLAGPLVTPTAATGSLVIGGLYDNSPNYTFPGKLDDVAIWNTELSAAQVRSLYEAYFPEPASVALLALGGLALLRRPR